MMQTYVVRRRGIARTAAELDAVLTRLRAFEDRPPALGARWLHSYALREADGSFGLACVFKADGAQTLQRHAELTTTRAGEILPVAANLLVRSFAPTMVYLVRRRNARPTLADLDHGLAVARHVADAQMARQVSWLQTYAVTENDGTLGTVCLYQAIEPAALLEHAARVDMPADEIVPVLGRIVFREEAPQHATVSVALPT